MLDFLRIYEDDINAGRINAEEAAEILLPWLLKQSSPETIIKELKLRNLKDILTESIKLETKGEIIRLEKPRDLTYNLIQAFHKELKIPYDHNSQGLENLMSYVYEIDENKSRRVIGLIRYALEPNEDYRNCAYVDVLYVLTNYRNRGYAKKLVEHMEKELPENIERIILFSPRASLPFYRALQFEESGHATTPLGEFQERKGNVRLFRLYKTKA